MVLLTHMLLILDLKIIYLLPKEHDEIYYKYISAIFCGEILLFFMFLVF